jgi:hypothetical protein
MKYKTLMTVALAVALTSCSEDKPADEVSENPDRQTLNSLLLAEAPAAPLEIAEMRKTAQNGETVTFKGTLIGDLDIFMEERAVMKMGDPKKLTACNLIPGDECETPCDDPAVIKASIVTVRVLDENGGVLKAGLKGVGGLEELRTVTVTGTVDSSSQADNMQINATGIYVHPGS